MATMYNSIRASRELQQAGVAAPMADAIASVIEASMTSSREELVTKDFLKAELGTVNTEITTAKNDTIRWLIGSHIVLITAIMALMNFMKATH